jgi:hypothetical protein
MINTANKPKIGATRYVVSWIDAEALRRLSKNEDLSDRLQQAERCKVFPDEASAKNWAELNFKLDEYHMPRMEKQTFGCDFSPRCDWESDEHYFEFDDGVWTLV